MLHDAWLDAWLPDLKAAAGTTGRVLELGCGHGDDTATLAAADLAVTAIDRSAVAVGGARLRAPSASLHVGDLRAPWPREDEPIGAVVASLSLHYFPWAETEALVRRIHRVLVPGGLLLCRLNSTDDVNFGATGHAEVEPHLHLVDGRPKRFFDRADVERLFRPGWHALGVRARRTGKYGRTKALWEVVLRKDGATAGGSDPPMRTP